MCQSNVHVWIALDPGKLLVINTSTFKPDHQIYKPELRRTDNLVEMITVDNHANLITLAYQDGLVAFVNLKFNSHRSVGEMHSLGFGILEEVNFKQEKIKLFTANVSSSQHLCAIEACKPQGNEQVELWCGCENGIIEILIPCKRTSQAPLKTVLDTHADSADIPKDASIIQLKSSLSAKVRMYALHSCGTIISCWNPGKQPVLNTVIKPSQLSSPGID